MANPECNHSCSLGECTSIPVPPTITTGRTFIKVPVVLTERQVEINVDATIKFPRPVLEIKDVKKRLKLTQCRLVPPVGPLGPTSVFKLFLKGFVRKNIQFASPVSGTRTSVSSNLQSLTLDIPFSCVTPIPIGELLALPVFETNSRTEFEFFTSTPLPVGFPAKETLLAGDLSEFNQMSTEFFNELPFCELIRADFTEFDEALDRTMGVVNFTSFGGCNSAPFEEGTFTTVEEKMVIQLTLKVLQNQQLNVTSSSPSPAAF